MSDITGVALKSLRWLVALPLAWISAWVVSRILLWVAAHNPFLDNAVSRLVTWPVTHVAVGMVIGYVVIRVAPEPVKISRWLALAGASITAFFYIAKFPDLLGVAAGLCQVGAAWYVTAYFVNSVESKEEEERMERARAVYLRGLPDDEDWEDDDEDLDEHVSPGQHCPNCAKGTLIRLRSGAVCCPDCSEKWHTSDQTSRTKEPIPVFLAEAVRDHLGDDFPAPSGNGSRSDPLVISATKNYVRYEYEAARVAMMLLGLDYKSEGNRLLSPQGGRYIDELVFAVKPRGAVEWTGKRSLFFDITAGFKSLK